MLRWLSCVLKRTTCDTLEIKREWLPRYLV
jgi:hypothetical protein